MSTPKFHSGYINGWSTEDRLFYLSLFKNIKTDEFTNIQKRMLKRLILRLMGESIAHIQVRDSVECKYCDREYLYIEKHEVLCAFKQKQMSQKPKIDPVVWEMLGGK